MRTLALVVVVAATACSGPAPAPGTREAEQPRYSAPAQLMTWSDLLSRPRVSPTHSIQWSEGATDIADLWLPHGAGPHPVVLMVHGGCWQKSIAGSRRCSPSGFLATIKRGTRLRKSRYCVMGFG